MVQKPYFASRKPPGTPPVPIVHIHIEFDPMSGNAKMSTNVPINVLVLVSILSGMAKAQADNGIMQASGLINPNRGVPDSNFERQPIEEPIPDPVPEPEK